MNTCQVCNRQFPSDLIQPLVLGGGRVAVKRYDSCPICALKLINEHHGTSRTDFDGPKAQACLRQARQFIGEKV